MMGERIKYCINLSIVALLLATVAIQRDGRVGGKEVALLLQQEQGVEREAVETTLVDGTRVINSAPLAKDVVGFAGRTPVKLYVKDEVIERIAVEPNSETPSFFDEVVESGLLERWDGLTLADAALARVDGVTGATYSSIAIIENVRRAAQYGAAVEVGSSTPSLSVSHKEIAGVLVVLIGVLFTLFKPKRRWMMNLLHLLNVVVLGFWCGSFLSLSTLTAWMSNGINLSLSLVTVALLLATLLLPFFGKRGSYCQLHCPMGAAQELLGQFPFTQIKLPPRLVKVLNHVRYYILSLLLLVMWLGVGFEWMNYEVFSAFIFTSASTVVLVMAALFLLLSLFVHRPYCRFVCPTGALITLSQKIK